MSKSSVLHKCLMGDNTPHLQKALILELQDVLKGEFEALKNDVERWGWIKLNQHLVTVSFSNDDLFVTLKPKWKTDNWYLQMDYPLGDSDGISAIMDFIGIDWNCL